MTDQQIANLVKAHHQDLRDMAAGTYVAPLPSVAMYDPSMPRVASAQQKRRAAEKRAFSKVMASQQ